MAVQRNFTPIDALSGEGNDMAGLFDMKKWEPLLLEIITKSVNANLLK
jgi:hypothetical protein